MTTHTFDISYECQIQEFLELLDNYGLKLESWITHGPGGGNPEITVSGTEIQIQKLQSEL